MEAWVTMVFMGIQCCLVMMRWWGLHNGVGYIYIPHGAGVDAEKK